MEALFFAINLHTCLSCWTLYWYWAWEIFVCQCHT